MKSKKLFAILTLVAFMMTLVPMAAFAGVGTTPYSTSKSTLAVADSSVDAYINMTTPEQNSAKFTITFKDAAGALVTGQTVDFTIKSNKDLAMGEVSGVLASSATIDSMALTTPDGFVVDDAVTDAFGRVVFYVGAQVATSFDISVYYYDDNAGSLGNKIGSTKTVTVKQSATGEIGLELFLDEDDVTAVADPTASGVLIAGEGFELRADYGEEDKEITFKQRLNGGSWAIIGTDTTDDDGIASLWVDTDTAGTYEFKAISGADDSAILTAKVFSGEPSVLEAKSVSGTAAVDKVTLVDVYVKDDAGNLVKSSNILYGGAPLTTSPVVAAGEIVKYEFVTVPDGSDLDGVEKYEETEARGFARYVFVPDEVGKYVIKMTLESSDATTDDLLGSDSMTIEYNVVELGTITKVTALLVDDTYKNVTPAIRYLEDATNEDPMVTGALLPFLYNAAGASFFTTTGFDGLNFSSSNPAAVSVDDTGALTVEDDAFTGTVTITMSYEDDAVIATKDVTVVGAPNAITATPTVTAKAADVKLQLVDKAGNSTTSTSGRDISKDAVTVIAPAGVTVSGISGISSNGTGSFKLTAAEAGKYSVTVLATVDETNATVFPVQNTTNAASTAAQKTISKTFDVVFTAAATDKPVAGAKTVTMFIGAPGYTQDGVAKVSDVAPFIKDGRTFVAVRPVADAFGAVIGWNEATQTVTLTRADVTVTIVIGSNAVKVVKAGVETTVTADVAAFIKDGRTVLPFRAVGEAFGATVNFDAATQAVTYVQ